MDLQSTNPSGRRFAGHGVVDSSVDQSVGTAEGK